MVNNNIEKLIFHKTDLFPMYDFGIYNFFRYSDNINKAKFIATVSDEKYVVAADFQDKSAHWQLIEKITDNFNEFDFCIGSLGNEIFVNKEDKLTDSDYKVLLSVLEEFKKYCDETGYVKYLSIYCDELRDDLKELNTSDKLDEIIDVVRRKYRIFNNKNNLVLQ